MKQILTKAALMLLVLAPVARAEWYDDMKVKGDVRYRFESIDEEDKDQHDRDRIRARVGVFPRLNPEVDAGIQVATGEEAGNKENPTSSNATMTDMFSGKGIYLDLGYFDWHMVKGLNAIGGKMKNPFIAVGDYMWDGDVNPEGMGLKYKTGEDLEFLANAGYFWVQERKEADDSKMYGGQLAVNFKPGDETHVMAGATYYLFDNMEGFEVIDWSGAQKSYGNSTEKEVVGSKTNSLYANDFGCVEAFLEAGFDIGIPVTLFASYVVNNDADEDDTGYMGGITLGKASDPNTFELAYNYRELEKNAWVGAIADSDSWGGGTDGSGHKITARYQVLKNWQASVSYFINDKKLEDSVDYNRLQVDLVAKF